MVRPAADCSSTMTVASRCSCRALAVTMLVTGPSTAWPIAFAFVLPLATRTSLRIEDGPDAHRDRIDRHILSALEEAGVVVDGLLGQRLEPRPRAQGAPRLVERDVAVRADAQDLQVDPAAFRNAPLVPLAERGAHC